MKKIFTLISFFYLTTQVSAAAIEPGRPGGAIVFSTIDNLLKSITSSIQYYTLPIMVIILAFLGIKLITSGDDTSSKDLVKNWMIKILIGGSLIFGASILAGAIVNVLG